GARPGRAGGCVPADDRASPGDRAAEVRVELVDLDAPLATAADLDGGQLPAAHQGVRLGRGDAEDLGDLGERDEPAGHGAQSATGSRATGHPDGALWTLDGHDGPRRCMMLPGSVADRRTPVSALPTPQARRLVKPSWRDARLIIGVLLVLLAVVIGAAAFSAADDRVGMWAAKDTLTPGQKVGEGDLVRVDVQLGDASSDYLTAGERLPNGAVVDRGLRAGELVPRSAA